MFIQLKQRKRELLGILYLKVSNVIDILRLSGLKICEKMEQGPEIDVRRGSDQELITIMAVWPPVVIKAPQTPY